MRNLNKSSNGTYSARHVRKMRNNLKRGARLGKTGDERENRAFQIIQRESARTQKSWVTTQMNVYLE